MACPPNSEHSNPPYADNATPPDLIIISPTGDLILDIHSEDGSEHFSYRVSTQSLVQASPYFATLLRSGTFQEARSLLAQQEALDALTKSQHPSLRSSTPPAELLPRVRVTDIGRTSRVGSIETLAADFLRVLHGSDVATSSPPLANLANLAVVADRFDALGAFARYVGRRKFLQAVDARVRSKEKGTAAMSEERVRQKLMLGVVVDHAPWVDAYSKRLIIEGSVLWRDDRADEGVRALWWDIPCGIEGEKPKQKSKNLSLRWPFHDVISSERLSCC